MIVKNTIVILLAYLLDKIIGDPLHWPHPVRWIGSLIAKLDELLNNGNNKRFKGLLMLLSVLLLSISAVIIIVYTFYKIHPIAGIIAEVIIVTTTIAQKSLREAAVAVYEPLINSNLQKARTKLSYIVGRDTDDLDEAEITRGAVETVAENICDGITAPLFWTFIGGAPLAIAYRTINTCDSMVGYKSDKYHLFGWSSAKLDDLVNWVPSRLTGILMLVTMKPQQQNWQRAVKVLIRDANKHPSPNSGWGEAAVAAILGVQLGGINTYDGVISNRAKMGDQLVPLRANHIKQAILIMNRTVLLFLITLLIGVIIIELAFPWS